MLKFFYYIAISFFIFVVSQQDADAQLFTKYKAKAGFVKVEEYAKVTGGMSNPKLQVIGTTNQTIPFEQLEITIEFDPAQGTSSGWLYVVVDASDTTKSAAYFAIKPIIGDFLIFEIPGLDFGGMGLEIEEGAYISDYNWMDSDLMAAKLLADADFMTFYNENKPFTQVFVGLFVGINPADPESGISPVWGISLANDDYQKFCTVHAVNGQTFCSPVISGVENYSNLDFEVYPNPASDFLNVNVTTNTDGSEISIFDIYGRLIISQLTNEGNNQINISDLSSGVYNIKVGNKFSKFIKQ